MKPDLPSIHLLKPIPYGLSRRRFLKLCGMGAVGGSAPLIHGAESDRTEAVAAAFDAEVREFMRLRNVPGGALAVVRNDKLVFARGYGWADREAKISVEPDSLFRIASVSKPITALAIMKLVEGKKLSLSDRAFEIVKLPPVREPDAELDPRLQTITIEQLLRHTAGWDSQVTPDPMFRSRAIAHVVGVICPPGPRDIIRYMLGRPLDFGPDTQFAYSNFGYCVLGRVIEERSGLSYEQFVQQQILAPAGVKTMRLGASLLENRLPKEVRYYMARNSESHSVFGNATQKVPSPYGGFCLESMDAHGGWVASVVDLARMAAALDNARESPILDGGTIRAMYQPPPAPISRTRIGILSDAYYGFGWMVRPISRARAANYWHNGSLPGTSSLIVRRWDGLSWAVLFNQRSEEIKFPDAAIDRALHRAADSIDKWPSEDQFDRW